MVRHDDALLAIIVNGLCGIADGDVRPWCRGRPGAAHVTKIGSAPVMDHDSLHRGALFHTRHVVFDTRMTLGGNAISLAPE
jgi:hypothetical protein